MAADVFKARPGGTRTAWSKGASPNASAARSEMASVKKSTVPSGVTLKSSLDHRASISLDQRAKIQPSAAPPATSNKLSVSNCRKSRPRPAPSAMRKLNSRCRAVFLATRSIATLTQAMTRTRPTIAMSFIKPSSLPPPSIPRAEVK